MNFVFIIVGMSIHVIFLFKRELLFEKKSFLRLLVLGLLSLISSYFLLRENLGNPKMVVLLRIPALSLLIFYIMKLLYFRVFGKNPDDTFWSMDIGMMKDGIFNFLFWVIGLLVPVFLSYKVL